VAPGHKVIYDVVSTAVIRSLHLDGTLQFAPDCDTRLEVGLIRVGAGGTTDEQGFDCTAGPDSTSHHASHQSNALRAELLVGLPEHSIEAAQPVMIRLHYIDGMAPAGAEQIMLQEEVSGWNVGDRIILTATTRQNKIKKTFRPSTRDSTPTEERRITAVAGRYSHSAVCSI